MTPICEVQLKHKRANDFMLMLRLNETKDVLAIANCEQWHGCESRREDGHVVRRAL